MQDQELAQIVLQKRMLDADLPRRTMAILGSGLAGLFFLTPVKVALYLCLYFPCDMALGAALTRLIDRPTSKARLRVVQVAAFACMSTYLIPAVLLWQVAGSTAKAGAMIHIFGGMLSIMLVRTAYRPMTIANSLPLAGVVPIIAILETETEGSGDQIFLGAAVLILAGYFILTLQAALRSNRALAGARDAALARVETQRRFLATMSHELRTPLNGILGIAQGLVASHPGQGAESICDSAREMSAMVDDLLDNAAIEAGALRIVRRPVHLSQMMQRLEERWLAAFTEKNLRLRLTISPDLPEWMMLDPLRLSQCLSNLLGNALRLTASGGVSVDLIPHPGGLEAVVCDTGPGLPDGMETRLFRAFELIHIPGGDQRPGTGLGLSISRGIARAMGGNLVYQKQETGGSRFRLTIATESALWEETPVSPADNSFLSKPETQTKADATPTQDDLPAGKTILLVDDIATNLLVLRILLNGMGLRTVEAASGAEALRLLQDPTNPAPDAALMDIRMPELSGIETLARMREAGHGFPVIAVTADTGIEGRAEVLALGFGGHVSKPVESAELRRVLVQALSNGSGQL